MRLAILTSGGDCPGLNAVIRAVVRSATDRHQWECVGIKNGWKGAATGEFIPLPTYAVSGIPYRGGTIPGPSALDVTFGFQTAVQIVTDAIDRLHTTAESHNRIMILETMGRNTGWIALCAGIAGGADLILIPERPFSYDTMCAMLAERHKRKSFSIVVVAEGAFPEGGKV